MAGILEARERLERAVARLEKAHSGRMERLLDITDGGGDIDDLLHTLEGVQNENAKLMQEREAMADGLDVAITRLHSVINPDNNPDSTGE